MVSTEIFTKGLTTYCFYQYRDVCVALLILTLPSRQSRC